MSENTEIRIIGTEVNVGDDLLLPDGSVRQVLAVLKAVDGSGVFSHSVVTV